MVEEGGLTAEGSALVDVEEELGNLPKYTAALTQMMQTVLQRLDMLGYDPSGSSGQVIGCRECPPHQTMRREHQKWRSTGDVGWTPPTDGQGVLKALVSQKGQWGHKTRVQPNNR